MTLICSYTTVSSTTNIDQGYLSSFLKSKTSLHSIGRVPCRRRRHGDAAKKTVRIGDDEAIRLSLSPSPSPVLGTSTPILPSWRLRPSPCRHPHANRPPLRPQTRCQTLPRFQVLAVTRLRQRPLGPLPPNPPPPLPALRRNRPQLRLPSPVSCFTLFFCSYQRAHESTCTELFQSCLEFESF